MQRTPWLLKAFWPVIVFGSCVTTHYNNHTATFIVDWHVGFITFQEKHTQNTKWSVSIVNAWGRTVAGRTNSEGVGFRTMREVRFSASSLSNKYTLISLLQTDYNQNNCTWYVVTLVNSVFCALYVPPPPIVAVGGCADTSSSSEALSCPVLCWKCSTGGCHHKKLVITLKRPLSKMT